MTRCAVPPFAIVLANVPGLDLPTFRVFRGVGETTTLETLEQDIGVGAGNLDAGPVRFSDRPAGCEVRVLEQSSGDVVSVLIDDTRGIHELPEWRRDCVMGDIVDHRNCDAVSGE